ncbi:DUF2138 family protein [Massilia sp. W12]|uniref:DUF2138 family protein n=1 Tax=Massilia sp. W12 TaxID=3126507 RepID=UPI0030D5B179
MNKKKLFAGGLVILAVFGLVWLAKARLPFGGKVGALEINLSQPDAWIKTDSLAQLPRDLLKVPLARDVLTEDLVNYYETHDERLSMSGAIRRIAYEHNMKWEDRLLEAALNEAAEVALWRDQRGALRHYLAVVKRNTLSKAIEQAAKIAASDTQLSSLGQISIDGDEVELLALNISNQRTFVVASHGERILLASSPELLFDEEQGLREDGETLLKQLLGKDAAGQQRYADYFQYKAGAKNEKAARHVLIMDANFMSFGYQHFFAGMQALRFEFDRQGKWSSAVLLDGKQLPPESLNDAVLWQAAPMDPAACALLPVDWQMGNRVLGPLPSEKVAALLKQFDGPAAICWYAQSNLHTPLILAHTKPGSKPDPLFLEQLFRWMIRGAQQAQGDKTKDGGHLWQHEVSAPFGMAAQAKAKGKDKKNTEGEETVYQPALAQQGDFIAFSPDVKLVQLALQTQAKRYPNLRDVLPKNSKTLVWLSSPKLAQMMRNETLQVLDTPGEELFLMQAKTHLWPKLDALKKYPSWRLQLSRLPGKDEKAWLPVEWHAVSKGRE